MTTNLSPITWSMWKALRINVMSQELNVFLSDTKNYNMIKAAQIKNIYFRTCAK